MEGTVTIPLDELDKLRGQNEELQDKLKRMDQEHKLNNNLVTVYNWLKGLPDAHDEFEEFKRVIVGYETDPKNQHQKLNLPFKVAAQVK